MANAYQAYVAKAMGLGFDKVTIINRQNYAPIAYSAPTDIATAWKEQQKDEDGKVKQEVQVNENQELLNWNQDATDKSKKRSEFRFYGQKFSIITSFDVDAGLVCVAGKRILCAYRFNAAWFLASAMIGGAKAKDDDKGTEKTDSKVAAPKFNTAQKGYSAIYKDVWADLVDAGW